MVAICSIMGFWTLLISLTMADAIERHGAHIERGMLRGGALMQKGSMDGAKEHNCLTHKVIIWLLNFSCLGLLRW